MMFCSVSLGSIGVGWLIWIEALVGQHVNIEINLWYIVIVSKTAMQEAATKAKICYHELLPILQHAGDGLCFD